MPHELEIIDGQACIAYNGETPWHGLGVKVDADCTPQQMQLAAGLDWEVELRPTFAEVSIDGKMKRVPTGYRALVRKDLVESDPRAAVLTTTGKHWHPIQNADQFEFYMDFVKKGSLQMSTAGSLRGGKMVWALAKAKDTFALFKGKDEVETNVLFYNPHEYGKSAGIMATPVRAVCANTMALALSGGAKSDDFHYRITHRKAFSPDEVKGQLQAVQDRVKLYKEQAELLASKRFDVEAFKQYCADVFPTKSKADEKVSRLAEIAIAALETQPGAQFGAGTWWAAFNAVTFTFDHLSGQQYKDEDDDTAMRDRRLFSTWFGWGARRKIWALDQAVKLATKSKGTKLAA